MRGRTAASGRGWRGLPGPRGLRTLVGTGEAEARRRGRKRGIPAAQQPLAHFLRMSPERMWVSSISP